MLWTCSYCCTFYAENKSGLLDWWVRTKFEQVQCRRFWKQRLYQFQLISSNCCKNYKTIVIKLLISEHNERLTSYITPWTLDIVDNDKVNCWRSRKFTFAHFAPFRSHQYMSDSPGNCYFIPPIKSFNGLFLKFSELYSVNQCSIQCVVLSLALRSQSHVHHKMSECYKQKQVNDLLIIFLHHNIGDLVP